MTLQAMCGIFLILETPYGVACGFALSKQRVDCGYLPKAVKVRGFGGQNV